LTLRDVVTGETFEIREVRGSEQISRWDVLFTRLLREREHFVMTGAALHLPATFRGDLRAFVEELWGHYQIRHGETAYADFLHASSQLVNQYILNEIAPVMNQPPTIVTMEGDLTEFCTATFDVLDYRLALAGLRATEELDEIEEETETEENEFTWHEVGESLDLLQAHGPAFEHKETLTSEPGATRILGNLRLSADELVLEVTSQRRLNAGKQLLQKHLGDAIQHRADEIRSLEQVMARADKEGTAEPAEQLEEEKPEELEAWEAEASAKFHRQWLDEKVPALGGQTPREAVKTLAGRVMVIRLLKQFEEVETRRARTGAIPYDLTELRDELGLTEAELLEEARLEDRLKDELEEIGELAHEDRLDDALAAWRAFRGKYAIHTPDDLDFSEVWDLAAIMTESILELTNRLAMFNRYDEAIAVLEEYIALDPEGLGEFYVDVPEMRIEKGEVERGVRELEELAERDPEDVMALETLGRAQRDLLNQTDAALTTFRRAFARATDEADRHDVYLEMLNTYLAARRLDEAERFWREANDALEETEQDYYSLVRLALARGDYARAREAADKIEDDEERAYWLGLTECLSGNPAAARQLWADHLQEPELDDFWPDWLRWTELHLRLGEADRVLEKIDPVRMHAGPSAYFDLALAYALKGDLTHAAGMARTARAEMERRQRRIHHAATLGEVRELAAQLPLTDAARAALGLSSD
jgi:tetratricopeptide (TPR) repeat protein